MKVCEKSLEKAIRLFLDEAQIPKPSHWPVLWDRQFVLNKIVPAFLHSLSEIEDIDLCYGFDVGKVDPCSPVILKGE